MSPTTINRLKVLGIGAIAVAPVLGSYLLYLFWSPGSYMNYGTLLAPRPVPTASFQTVDGGAFSFSQLRGRWAFAIFDEGRCPPDCERKLWVMRQVRQAQGKDVARIERVYLVDDGAPVPNSVKHDYAGTWFVFIAAKLDVEAFPAERSKRDHIYLVDPQGNVMLRFPTNADPKRMIKDISRLLRYSRTG